MYESDPYRGCPICGKRLSRLMDYKEKGRTWQVFTCRNCGSEVSIDPFKEIRERYLKKKKGIF